jgi:hypothetical protein
MYVVILGLLLVLVASCSKDHDQNDPYIIEETEVEYQPPGPYYDEKDY